MKCSLAFACPLFVGGLFLFGCTNSRGPLEKTVVVRVDRGCELTTGELAFSLARRLKDFNSLSARSEEVIGATKNSIINEFVVACLTKKWAKEKSLFVRKEQLDAEINTIKNQYPDELSFRQSLIEADLTYDEWVILTESKILERLVTETLRKDVPAPSKEEVRQYYSKNTDEFKTPAQMKVSQIVVKTEDQAKLVDDQLKSGRDFPSLAKKYSISPEGPEGGDLGWVERETHEMFEPVNRLGIGQRTRIIKTPFGYHILKLMGRRAARTRPLSEVEGHITRILQAKREQQAYSKWLEAEILRSQVYKNDEVIRSVKVVARGN